MTEMRVSIGRVKRDISDLVNRVAYGRERIVLTSRGKPKAAIVSMDDLECLEQEEIGKSLARWGSWLAESDRLAADIMARRRDKPLNVDALWQSARADLEERDAQTLAR